VVLDLLHNFTSRRLGTPSDALNAVLGILSKSQMSATLITHVWGVPALPALPQGKRKKQANPLSQQWATWSTAMGFVAGLSWEIPWQKSFATRQQDFPSWSWAGWSCRKEDGWNCEKEWGKHSSDWEFRKVDFDVKVDVELQNGSVIDIDEMCSKSSNEAPPNYLSKAIHITGRTVRIAMSRTNGRRILGSIEQEDGPPVEFLLLPDDIHAANPEDCIGILLYEDLSGEVDGPQLLMTGMVGGRRERIGTYRIDVRKVIQEFKVSIDNSTLAGSPGEDKPMASNDAEENTVPYDSDVEASPLPGSDLYFSLETEIQFLWKRRCIRIE
jgi:hypothetical protein